MMDDKTPEEQEEFDEQKLREELRKIMDLNFEISRRNHEEESQFEATIEQINRISGQAYRAKHGIPLHNYSDNEDEEDDDESEHEIGDDEIDYDAERKKRAE
jgi:hypothetical protein